MQTEALLHNQLANKIRRVVDWANRNRSPNVKAPDTKTIGVHITAVMRQRILGVQRKHQLKYYRDAVYLCILAGLDALDVHDG